MNANELIPFASVIAIAGMAAMTFLMRAGGFWLMGHLPITPRMRRMLEALPGAVVAAIVLPIMVRNGIPAWLGVAAVIGAMVLRRNEFIALAAGMAVVSAARAFGF